jgi:hypothetical protein
MDRRHHRTSFEIPTYAFPFFHFVRKAVSEVNALSISSSDPTPPYIFAMILTTILLVTQSYDHTRIMNTFAKTITAYLFIFAVCGSSFQMPFVVTTRNDASSR